MDEIEVVEDVTPSPYLLKSFINAEIANYAIFGELIDNAWDWGATRITISLDEDVLTIKDNGVGCTNMKQLIKLGDFHGANRTGRFGVGMKQAVMALGPILHVESIAGDKRVKLILDWVDASNRAGWDFVRPIITSVKNRDSFMQLKVFPVFNGRLRRLRETTLRERISLMYYPALTARKEILFLGERLSPFPFPDLAARQVSSGYFKDRKYRLTMGLFKQPEKKWTHGFNLAFRDRIIAYGINDVYGDYDPHGFFAYVEVIEDTESKWEFNTNKNGIIDQTEFLESLFPLIEPLLKRAAEQHQDIHDKELISRIEADLNAALDGRPRKEKRKPGKSKGAHSHTGNGASRVPELTQPAEEQSQTSVDCEPGTNGHCTGYRISFNYEGPEIASIDLGKKVTFIRFYPGHPAVSQWRKTQDHRELYLQAHNLILTRQRIQPLETQIRFMFYREDGDPFQDYIEKLSAAAAKTYQKK
jgi:hypothetical protein